jgi:hypothetical protein
MSELYEIDPQIEMYEDFGFNGYYNDKPMFLDTYVEIKELEAEIEFLKKENATMREALVSIGKNTCCDSCQEAKLVATKALNELEKGEKENE